MQKTINLRYNEDDSYETTFDTENFTFGLVWRFRANLHPTPHGFLDLPKAVQEALESKLIKSMNSSL